MEGEEERSKTPLWIEERIQILSIILEQALLSNYGEQLAVGSQGSDEVKMRRCVEKTTADGRQMLGRFTSRK
jgi:hypothetical protein